MAGTRTGTRTRTGTGIASNKHHAIDDDGAARDRAPGANAVIRMAAPDERERRGHGHGQSQSQPQQRRTNLCSPFRASPLAHSGRRPRNINRTPFMQTVCDAG